MGTNYFSAKRMNYKQNCKRKYNKLRLNLLKSCSVKAISSELKQKKQPVPLVKGGSVLQIMSCTGIQQVSSQVGQKMNRWTIWVRQL